MRKVLKTLLISAAAVVSMMGLASCDEELSAEQAILKEALDTPSLAVKTNGFGLESMPKDPEKINGAIIMLRDIVIYVEEVDLEYEVEITWSFPEETSDQWFDIAERDGIIGLVEDARVYVASPILPAFGGESVKSALIATAHMFIDDQEFTREKEYPVIILPEEMDINDIKLIPLNAVKAPDDTKKDSYGNKIVRVRGYLTRNISDWNSSYINEGIYGMSLYRLDASPELIINANVGQYIEVIGQFATYMGLRQMSYISKVTPVSDEGATPLAYKEITTNAIWDAVKMGDDGGQIKMEGLTYHGYDGDDDEPTFVLGTHLDIYMKFGGKSLTVSMTYHLDTEKIKMREQIYAILSQAVDGATITYTGVLSWYSVPVLLPILLTDITLVPAPAAA